MEETQEKVLNCFAYVLAQNHVQEPGLLAQVLMCMPTLRTISTSYLELTSVSTPTQQWSNWPVELCLDGHSRGTEPTICGPVGLPRSSASLSHSTQATCPALDSNVPCENAKIDSLCAPGRRSVLVELV